MKNDSFSLLQPARLVVGDHVGVVAPAGPVGLTDIQAGLKILKNMGLKPRLAHELFNKSQYLAGTDAHRAEQIHAMFADQSIKGIICARGGFGSMRLLSLLNFELIHKNPKIFIGFSDISALLSVFYSVCGLPTFHGPVLTTLKSSDAATLEALSAVLFGSWPIKLFGSDILNFGKSFGPVCGGNLSTLCHLFGTPYAPKWAGHILFLEDVGEPAYKIDRMLTQMKLAGAFENICGLMLGSFKDCAKKEDIFYIVKNLLKNQNIPILAGFDIGHGNRNLTLPMGIPACLDTNSLCLEFYTPATYAA